MQSLRKLKAARGLDLQDIQPPKAPGPGEVLLRVKSAGVCGTDLHIDEWTPSYHFVTAVLPVTVGHEFSGEVAACGDGVSGLLLQQLMAVRPSVVCGQCEACLAGEPDGCVTRRGIGVTRDGGFAPWVLVPARNCVPIPAGVDAEVAALTEPLTVSPEAVRTGSVRRGDRVLVLGPGNIGQGIAIFARAAGDSQVVVAGHGDTARFKVLRKMGFTDLVHLDDHANGDMASGLAAYLQGGKFDVVIEATGAAAVIGPALRALKTHGVLVITGIHAAPVPIDLTALVRQHQQIRGSYRAPERAWPEVVDFMRSQQETLRHMITHRVPLPQAYEGFALARNKVATKVMVQPKLQAGASPRPEPARFWRSGTASAARSCSRSTRPGTRLNMCPSGSACRALSKRGATALMTRGHKRSRRATSAVTGWPRLMRWPPQTTRTCWPGPRPGRLACDQSCAIFCACPVRWKVPAARPLQRNWRPYICGGIRRAFPRWSPPTFSSWSGRPRSSAVIGGRSRRPTVSPFPSPMPPQTPRPAPAQISS